MDKTVSIESNLGKRLSKIKKVEERCLVFKNKQIPLVSKISIGRDPKNNIVLHDKMVSRFHAEIQKIKSAFFITDLNSSNGTYVNDVKVPEGKYIKLKENDKIRLGKNELSII
ncbi:MAG: FHA domain-containing protein [Spirochaetes bacterium]|nr:FHA domain-containing protein [Spirochaetota bacterium]